MANTRSSPARPRWHRGKDVPLALIRRFARQVAERFDPEKIILFGSYAYGRPHADSDVDIMVVMPTRNQIDQACRIDDALDPPFPLDLIVRTPKNLAARLAHGDSFLREIMAKGKILYEKEHGRMGGQGGGRLSVRHQKRPQRNAV
ncbi:MAG TPA: nucleotidyltransferase domain-containing protein [Pirellulales bacterium]|nr:nucleotidyltransferase domain-containing protein [Pirellulales bacterium]